MKVTPRLRIRRRCKSDGDIYKNSWDFPFATAVLAPQPIDQVAQKTRYVSLKLISRDNFFQLFRRRKFAKLLYQGSTSNPRLIRSSEFVETGRLHP
jgi:hypothetical protein